MRVGDKTASATLNLEAVNPVEVKGEGSLLGMLGGGVAAGLLGSQTVAYDTEPSFRIGDKVRVNNGTVTSAAW
ncbi:MAG: hypothetical protein ACK5NY_04200 [Burkholderiaceae bacterium]